MAGDEVSAQVDRESGVDWTPDAIADRLDVTDGPAARLAEEYDSEEHFLENYRLVVDFTDHRGIGTATSESIREYVREQYPELERERLENDEAICTEYTLEHGLDDDQVDADKFYFAFICPRCEATNPLRGDPNGFGGRPFKCRTCYWVPLLASEFLAEWMTETDGVPFTSDWADSAEEN